MASNKGWSQTKVSLVKTSDSMKTPKTPKGWDVIFGQKVATCFGGPANRGPVTFGESGCFHRRGRSSLRASKKSRFLSNIYFRPLIGEKMSLHLQRSAKYGPTTCRQVAGGWTGWCFFYFRNGFSMVKNDTLVVFQCWFWFYSTKN